MYKVRTYHFKKVYKNGYLEEDYLKEGEEDFETRKEAINFVENTLIGVCDIVRNYQKRQNSFYIKFIDNFWTNENSGEENQEFYKYSVTKI